jgi:hypothetical protein
MRVTKAKATVGATSLLVTALAGVFADDVLDTTETGALITALFTAGVGLYGIWRVPNKVVADTHVADAPGHVDGYRVD